ncbi:MAG: hypothetical protein CMJ31_01870 [Phycisphaerae bacterium]|nr:hypothetical protein [Phycisphaerae bacterium]|tara:strand:+ start:139 stop:552 length:414 start_codon:yes stop_codon:yes gene_type:complete
MSFGDFLDDVDYFIQQTVGFIFGAVLTLGVLGVLFLAAGVLWVMAAVFFVLGGLICVSNAWWGARHLPCINSGRPGATANIGSPLPIVGSTLVLLSLGFGWRSWLWVAFATVLLLVDTGGPVWFVYAMVRGRLSGAT